MAIVPGARKKDVFTDSLTGSYGRFKTNHSFRLDYLMTSVPIKRINTLYTASDIFPIEEINFEALIQRSIDKRRVQKIANEYLEQGAGKVVFFPPLLACVILLDKEEAIKERYEKIDFSHTSTAGDPLKITWDIDGFQFELPIAESTESDRQAEFDGCNYHYFEYAASLKLNPTRAKLVVLDGQHRLEAIKLLWGNKEKKHIVSEIEVPICVVWAPSADHSTIESMSKDFRELFVRVNHEAKTVSGHFITLLKDNSYSACTIRKLADRWKNQYSPGNWNRLHLLEWNEREDNKVDQRTRQFSITTISIISRFLEDYIFNNSKAASILELTDVRESLEAIEPEVNWTEINDATISKEFDKIIEIQIDKTLVSALNTIFRLSAPYLKLETNVGNAFEKLQKKVDENTESFISLKQNYLGKYIYKKAEYFEAPALGALEEFQSWIKTDDSDRIFFYQVFQQALLRLWANVAADLHNYNISTENSTLALINSLNNFIFSKGKEFLTSGKRYTNRILWRNESILQGTTGARNNWLNALTVTLLRESCREDIHSYLESKTQNYRRAEIDKCLLSLAAKSARDYVSALRIEILKETDKNFDDYFESEEKIRALQLLKLSNKKEDKENFKEEINKKSEQRLLLALTDMSNNLGVAIEEISDQ